MPGFIDLIQYQYLESFNETFEIKIVVIITELTFIDVVCTGPPRLVAFLITSQRIDELSKAPFNLYESFNDMISDCGLA